MKHLFFFRLICFLLLGSCHEEDPEIPSENTAPANVNPPPAPPNSPPDPLLSFYYPTKEGSDWKTVSIDSLGWNKDKLSELLSFVKNKNTFGFIILYKGRIAIEQYWNGWDASTQHYI